MPAEEPLAAAGRLTDAEETAGAGPRPEAQLPEVGRLWIRYLPRAGRGWRAWPGPGGPWLDLAAGALAGVEATAGELPSLPPPPLDDVLYLPPVDPAHEAARGDWARRHLDRGTPVLLQCRAGAAFEPPAGATVVFDLLPALLRGEEEALSTLPAGAAAVWPLISGLTDDPALWRRGCARLAQAGVAVVQAVCPQLTPTDRRWLVEGRGDAAFDALFHGEVPDPRAFARVAHRHGLAPFLPRPLPRPPLRGAGNRRLAGLLALAGELWLRLGRPAGRGQGFFRAAREADRSTYDLAALERDGNLGVLTWLDGEARRFVEEALAGGTPPLLEELRAEYLQG